MTTKKQKQIIDLLKNNDGLIAREIIDLLGIKKSNYGNLYRRLDTLQKSQIIYEQFGSYYLFDHMLDLDDNDNSSNKELKELRKLFNKKFNNLEKQFESLIIYLKVKIQNDEPLEQSQIPIPNNNKPKNLDNENNNNTQEEIIPPYDSLLLNDECNMIYGILSEEPEKYFDPLQLLLKLELSFTPDNRTSIINSLDILLKKDLIKGNNSKGTIRGYKLKEQNLSNYSY